MRERCRGGLRMVLWGLALIPSAALRAADVASGEARLPSGVTARYEYHFDRNALLDSRRAGDALIALTASGNLLRFDPATRKLSREWYGPAMAVCLGRGEGGAVLAGFEDGRVCRIDPATLALAEVARLPGKPLWVGFAEREARGLVVAVEEPRRRVIERFGKRLEFMGGQLVVHDLVAGKSYEIEADHWPTFFLDSKRRLWLGADRGEWGGWCRCLDLASGELTAIPGIKRPEDEEAVKEREDEEGERTSQAVRPSGQMAAGKEREGEKREDGPKDEGWEGVYGFVELPDGQVWAYGGTSHFGSNSAFIRRVDGAKIESLAQFDNDEEFKAAMQGKEVPRPDRPVLPITHIIQERDHLLVFSYNDIFRTDARLKLWSKVHELNIRYRWGRPNAMGSYPSVRAVHLPGGQDGGLLCATALDSYVLVIGDKETHFALPGQLGSGRITRIENTAEGTFFLEWDDRIPPWRFEAGTWRLAPLEPPFDLHPDDPRAHQPGAEASWYETRLLAGPGGAVFTISATSWSNGTRMTARWRRGKAEILGREVSGLNPPTSFITADGELWSASFGAVKRFIGGKWVKVAALPGADPQGPQVRQQGDGSFRLEGQGLDVGYGLRTVGDAGPPWFLLDRDRGHLLSLAYGREVEDPRLNLIPVAEGDHTLRIHDAIPWERDRFLLATDRGLRIYEAASGKLSPAPLPAPERPVTMLCRDGRGRLWLGGAGLWMAEADGKTLHPFDALPMIGRPAVPAPDVPSMWRRFAVTALAADPKRDDGIIAALGERGVAFVQATRIP
jgi:hypothetical protein